MHIVQCIFNFIANIYWFVIFNLRILIIILLILLGIIPCNNRCISRSFIDEYVKECREKRISLYDDIFKKEVGKLGWDWKILASVVWNESRFSVNATSSQGARGLMQFMPRTAERFGLVGDDVIDPEKSIKAGVDYLLFLDRRFDDEILDREERIKFVLASYNAGPGHVRDAMALAKKYGDNFCVWNGNVEKWLLALQERKYYNDEVCKYGFFYGRYTVKYVQNVFDRYYLYSGQVTENI